MAESLLIDGQNGISPADAARNDAFVESSQNFIRRCRTSDLQRVLPQNCNLQSQPGSQRQNKGLKRTDDVSLAVSIATKTENILEAHEYEKIWNIGASIVQISGINILSWIYGLKRTIEVLQPKSQLDFCTLRMCYLLFGFAMDQLESMIPNKNLQSGRGTRSTALDILGFQFRMERSDLHKWIKQSNKYRRIAGVWGIGSLLAIGQSHTVWESLTKDRFDKVHERIIKHHRNVLKEFHKLDDLAIQAAFHGFHAYGWSKSELGETKLEEKLDNLLKSLKGSAHPELDHSLASREEESSCARKDCVPPPTCPKKRKLEGISHPNSSQKRQTPQMRINEEQSFSTQQLWQSFSGQVEPPSNTPLPAFGVEWRSTGQKSTLYHDHNRALTTLLPSNRSPQTIQGGRFRTQNVNYIVTFERGMTDTQESNHPLNFQSTSLSDQELLNLQQFTQQSQCSWKLPLQNQLGFRESGHARYLADAKVRQNSDMAPSIGYRIDPPRPPILVLKQNIFAYFKKTCWKEVLDGRGILVPSAGAKICENFDSYCFTATMFHRRGLQAELKIAISKAFDLLERVLVVEHPRTLACLFEVLMHFKQTGFDAVASYLCSSIKKLSQKIIDQKSHWGRICQLLGELEAESLDEIVDEAWRFTADTFDSLLGSRRPISVSLRLDYIKRVYAIKDQHEEGRQLKQLLHELGDFPQPSTPRVMLNIAHNYNRRQKYEDAATVARDVHRLLREEPLYAGRITEQIESVKLLSHCYFYQGMALQAESSMRSAIEMIKKDLGEQHAWVLEFMNVLESWLLSWNRKEDADTLRIQIEAIIVKDTSER